MIKNLLKDQQNYNVKSIVKLIIIMVVLAITALVTFLGLPLSKVVGYYDIEPVTSSIHYGLDLPACICFLEAAEEDMATVCG